MGSAEVAVEGSTDSCVAMVEGSVPVVVVAAGCALVVVELVATGSAAAGSAVLVPVEPEAGLTVVAVFTPEELPLAVLDTPELDPAAFEPLEMTCCRTDTASVMPLRYVLAKPD